MASASSKTCSNKSPSSSKEKSLFGSSPHAYERACSGGDEKVDETGGDERCPQGEAELGGASGTS